MDKQIWLVIPGTGDEGVGREATVDKETTAAQLLDAAGMDANEWQLQLQRDDDFVSMSGQDQLFKQVKNGDKVYVVSADMVVGRRR